MKKLTLIFFMILSFTGSILAQNKITGQVKNKDGETVPGVAVTIKGTKQAAISNVDGFYSLVDVPADATLVFTFVGMKVLEVPVNGQATVNATMEDDFKTLDEVVVVGYGQVKRANLTGAVVSISSDEIKDIPAGDLSSTLKGKLNGVSIDKATGKPGAVSTFKIRTESTYGAAGEESPLFVIDGIVRTQEDFDILDPSEVESLSVLKDASATVYGIKGGAGVVLVKTKAGKKGKPKISYSGSYGLGQATTTPSMLSAYDHASMLNEIYGMQRTDDDVQTKPTSYSSFTDKELESYKNTDYNWLNKMWKNAYQARNTLNISGGNDRVTFFAGGAVYKEVGNIRQSTLDRYSVRTNVEGKISDGLTANFGLSYDTRETNNPNYSGEEQGGVLRSFYKQLLTAPRWIPMEVDGKPIYSQKYINWNPYGLVKSNNYKKSNGDNTNINVSLNYNIPVIKGLTAKVQYSRTASGGNGKEYRLKYNAYELATEGEHSHIYTTTFKPGAAIEVPNGEDRLYFSYSSGVSYQLDASLSYAKKIGKHDISALLIYEQTESESNGLTSLQTNPLVDGYDLNFAFSSNSNTVVSSSKSESGNLGYIGRFNYIYDEKYIFEATFREDATYAFAPGNRWGFFPMASLGWIVSSENFFKDNVPMISFMKIRGSSGLLGSDKTPNSEQYWLRTYTADKTGALFGSSVTKGMELDNGGLVTPTITWQKTISSNVGLDLKFFNDHLSFTTEYYYKYSYDIFDTKGSMHDTIPSTVGLSDYPYENYGRMYAKGLEFEVGYNGAIRKDFSYNASFRFAWNKGRKLRVYESKIAAANWDSQLKNDVNNQPGLICTGMIRTQADLDNLLAKYPNYTIDGLRPALGMLTYKDIHGSTLYDAPDGKIDGKDIGIIAKTTSPPYVYSFNCGVGWKGLKLNLNFNGEFGHKVFIQKDEQVVKVGNNYTHQAVNEQYNGLSFWKDHWTADNPNAAMPRPYKWGMDGQISTFWMRNGNTLRLTVATLSYTMPDKITKKIGIPELRIYATATNVWTIISPYDYKDPSVAKAYDYPLIKSYNLGLNVSF